MNFQHPKWRQYKNLQREIYGKEFGYNLGPYMGWVGSRMDPDKVLIKRSVLTMYRWLSVIGGISVLMATIRLAIQIWG